MTTGRCLSCSQENCEYNRRCYCQCHNDFSGSAGVSGSIGNPANIVHDDEVDDSMIDVQEVLFDRIERDGVGVITVEDGTIFGFTAAVLRRLLSDAESREEQKVIVFVKRGDQKKTVEN